MTLMPGLIDCRDDLANWVARGRAGCNPTQPGNLSGGQPFERTCWQASGRARCLGREPGDEDGCGPGLIPGPRLKIGVNIICQFGGHNDHTEPAGVDSTYPKLQTIPDGVCDRVDTLPPQGAGDGAGGRRLDQNRHHRQRRHTNGGPLIRQFSLEEVRAIVDTAHAAGKPVMSHAYGGEGVKICLDAGVDSIEHGAALDDGLIEQMVRQNTWLVPTFTVLRKIVALGS